LELSYIKIGIFPPRSSTIPEALETLPAPSVPRIAVLLVDHAPPESLALDRLKAAGFSGVMLDTGRKGEERLRDYVPPAALQSFVEAAKAAGLIVGLAGRLRALDIAALAPLQPDYLGFRSALCYEEERSQSIDPMACRTIARELLAYTPVLLTE
jgi:dihydroneopterin aldolase